MRFDKWAVTAQEALQGSVTIAADAEAGQVMPIHLLKALLSSGERNLHAIIERVGADPTQIEAATDDAIARDSSPTQTRASTWNFAASRPMRSWPSRAKSPSSSISPNTATRLPFTSIAENVANDAAMESGFAL